MQNPPPYPEQNPPNYQPHTPPYSQTLPPYSQAAPTNYPPRPPYSQPAPPTPPYPAYSQPVPPAYPPYPPYPPYAQAQDNTTALVLEAVCSVFGLYGIGWLFRGRVGMGVALLALGFVWIAFASVATIFTAGLALLCLESHTPDPHRRRLLMLNSSLRQP